MWKVQDVPGRGRGLFASRDIRAGEVVLAEAPTMLIVNQECRATHCCNCLRVAEGGQLCQACGQAIFCSPACHQAATSSPQIHSPDLCRALSSIASCAFTLEEQSQARFLLQLLVLRGLREQDPEQRFAKFLSLTDATHKEHLQTATKLHAFIATTTGIQISAEELASLLSREQLNSYGILSSVSAEGERSIRGSGVYLQASFINHECAPTLARFDDFDRTDPPGNTVIAFQALHDLPAGTELVQSYVPLGWDLQERQQHLQQVYGFKCNCPRCLTESSPEWKLNGSSDGEWETDSGEGAEEEGDDDDVMEEGTSGMEDYAAAGSSAEAASNSTDPSKALDPTYLQLFLLKYICPKPQCGGTLAPVLGMDVHECNVCGFRRTEQQFLHELERQ